MWYRLILLSICISSLIALHVEVNQLPGIYTALQQGTATPVQAREFIEGVLKIKELYKQGNFKLCHRLGGHPAMCSFLQGNQGAAEQWMHFYDTGLVQHLQNAGQQRIEQLQTEVEQLTGQLNHLHTTLDQQAQELQAAQGAQRGNAVVVQERDAARQERDAARHELTQLQGVIQNVQQHPNNPASWSTTGLVGAGAVLGAALTRAFNAVRNEDQRPASATPQPIISQQELTQLRAQLRQSQATVQEMERQRNEARASLVTVRGQRDQAEQELERVRQQVQHMQQEIGQLRTQLTEAQQTHGASTQQVAAVTTQLHEVVQMYNEVTEVLQRLQQEHAAIAQQAHEALTE